MSTHRDTAAQEAVHLPGAPENLIDVQRDLRLVFDVDGFRDAAREIHHTVRQFTAVHTLITTPQSDTDREQL